MNYEISWRRNGVKVSFHGKFTFQGNNEASIEVWNSENFKDTRYMIWDLSNVNKVDLSHNEISLISNHDKLVETRSPNIEMAILTGIPETIEAATAYIANCMNLKSKWCFLVTSDLEEIEKWIAS